MRDWVVKGELYSGMLRPAAVLLIAAALLLTLPPTLPAQSSFGFGAVDAAPATFGPLRAAGVRAVKILADWAALEGTRGTVVWTGLDAAVAAARKEGLQPVLVLAYVPPWASLATGEDLRQPSVATRTPPKQIAEWERFVTAAVRRYRETVKEWQVWTTPALPHFRGTASEYLRLVAATRRASLAADRESRIIMTSPPGIDLSHVQRALAQEPGAISIVSVMPTGLAPEEWLRPLAVLRGRVLARTNRPLWVEWHPERPDLADGPAAVRAAAVARAAGIERLFTSLDLRRIDAPTRAALDTLATLPFGGYLHRGPGLYALLFGPAERAVLVAWAEGGPGPPLELAVLPDAKIQLLGAGPAPAIQEGKAILPLGPAPMLVTGLAPAVVEEARATLAQRGALLPVRPPERDFAAATEVTTRLSGSSVERGLYNILRTRKNGAVQVVQMGGEEVVRVPAQGEAAFIYFDVDDTFIFFNDGRATVEVTVEVAGARAAQSLGFNIFYDARSGYRFSSWQWVEVKEGWVSYTVRLDDASFANTWGWDFAINAGAQRKEDLTVRSVTVRKVGR
ncbi:MAG TPA: hypothetical protein VGR25_08240 [bacterium]|jgi:hypothetical protein|nr:hypothetical protein [bacterium]